MGSKANDARDESALLLGYAAKLEWGSRHCHGVNYTQNPSMSEMAWLHHSIFPLRRLGHRMLTLNKAFRASDAFLVGVVLEETFMKRNTSLIALSTAFLVTITVILVLSAGAWAQSKYKTLYKFKDGEDGGTPAAGLIFDQAGSLYGAALTGGKGSGVVFQLIPNPNGGWTQKVLHQFIGGEDGAGPGNSLIFDLAGNLYGTTSSGGSHDSGTVFQLVPNADGSWTENTLYSFCSRTDCADGSLPDSSLIFDPAGSLYGTTIGGGANQDGTVFQLVPNLDGSWTENVLYSFCSRTNCADGSTPYSNLIFDSAGNLYGTTPFGGSGGGVVFQLVPNADGSWTENVLHSFIGEEGYQSFGGLVFDPAEQNLYGVTTWGGTHSGGTAFKLKRNANGSWTDRVLHNFCSRMHPFCADGYQPVEGVIFDVVGNLYGTTFGGGTRNSGVVFKLTPNPKGGWKESVLHTFLNDPGAAPDAGLIFDPTGKAYGTTQGDGHSTFGSVFEVTP